MDGECSDNQPDGDDILHDGESGDDLSFFVSGEEQAMGFLTALVKEKIPVVRFELREPSLHEIFVEKVGTANE